MLEHATREPRSPTATAGSLLIAVLAHVGAHLNNSHTALPGEVLPLVVHAIVYAALGLAALRGAAIGFAPRRRVLPAK